MCGDRVAAHVRFLLSIQLVFTVCCGTPVRSLQNLMDAHTPHSIGQFLTAWADLSPWRRRHFIRLFSKEVASHLSRELSVMDISLTASRWDGETISLVHSGSTSRSQHVHDLALWLSSFIPQMTWPEMFRFVRSIHQELKLRQPVPDYWTRHNLHLVRNIVQKRIRLEFNDHLQQARPTDENASTGEHLFGERSIPDVVKEIEQAISDSTRTSFLHGSRRSKVFNCELFGISVVVKVYHVDSTQLKYKWHRSRARRAWAAARVLSNYKLPTPPPLGFIEEWSHGLPVRSYFISSPIDEAHSSRLFLKPYLHRESEEIRREVRHELHGLFGGLHAFGLLHCDAKASNLLLKKTGTRRQWWWIDLEDIRPGRYTLRRITRNLVQLNGSIGHKILREERLAFARGFRRFHPLAASGPVLRYIERRTLVRLQRELDRRCGP